MNSNGALIARLASHISQALTDRVSLDRPLIHSILNLLNPDNRLQASDIDPLAEAVTLLVNLVELATIDPDLVIRNVISAVVPLCLTFEVISHLVPLLLVLKGLETPAFQHTVIADVITRSGDHLAGTEVYSTLLSLYFEPTTALSVVELILSTLCTMVASLNPLVRRRIGGAADVALILEASLTGSSMEKIRLADLMLALLPLFPEGLFKVSWYTHPAAVFASDDVLLVGNLIRYYTGLVNLAAAPLEVVFPERSASLGTWILSAIEDQIESLGAMYASRSVNEDVGMFYCNELIQFFARLSYVDPRRMLALDVRHSLVGDQDQHALLLLEMVDPAYLYHNHKALVLDAILSSLPLRLQTLPVVYSLLRDPHWLTEISSTPHLSARSLNALQYDQVLRVVDVLTQTEPGVRQLLALPLLMSDYVLSNRFGKEAEGVTLDQDLFSLKRAVLDRLVNRFKNFVEATVWWDRTREAYRSLVSGERQRPAIPTIHTQTG